MARATFPGGIVGGAWRFPVIRSKRNKSDGESTWQIYVRAKKDDEYVDFDPMFLDNKPTPYTAEIRVDSGVEGGKIRSAAPNFVKVGKNIGKSNETTAIFQAMKDAESKYKLQLRKSTVGDDSLYPPMLAKVRAKAPPLDFPVYVQRKYDGIRVVATLLDGEVVLYTRTKVKLLGFQYLRDDLLDALKYAQDDGRHLYFDGELYKHGVPLQTINGNGRRENTVVTDYDYMVYDCFVPDEPNLTTAERNCYAKRMIYGLGLEWTKYVETFTANNEEEISDLYRRFIDEGYEGAMVRDMGAPYEYSRNSYHSSKLLKIKPTGDAEYKIVDWDVGTEGKAAGALLIVCETARGKRFTITPTGELPARMQLAEKMKIIESNGNSYFDNVWRGVYITVTYDDLSIDGIPLRARTDMKTRVDEPRVM